MKAAAPEELSKPLPKTLAPSRKFTFPDGVPVPGAVVLTLAVNVTDWPNTDELAVLANDVIVVLGFTVWVILPVTATKFAPSAKETAIV